MVSDEQLLDDLREFADELGKSPSASEMNESGPWSDVTYNNHFGSWNNALRKVGLETNNNPMHSKVSKEKLIADLQALAEELGRTPTREEMAENGQWSRRPYEDRFGSWNNTLERAGLKKNLEQDVSKDRLILELQEFSDELGRTPTSYEMYQNGPRSLNAYKRAFGSWNNALEKAGLEINLLSTDERSGRGEYSYGEGWHNQRLEVIERDNNMCRVCGDNEFVHVHHIKPRREFDNVSNSNTFDNLITLCPSCHRRFEGRWQNATPDEFAEKAKEHR